MKEKNRPRELQADRVDSLSGLIVHFRGDGVPLHDINHQTGHTHTHTDIVNILLLSLLKPQLYIS